MPITGSPLTYSTYGYASASDVAQLCRNLLGSANAFSTSTSPTLDAVNNWLSSGCAFIETKLSALGYTTPVAATAPAFSWLTDLNTLYAAARAEMSRINVTLAPGERTRGQVFQEMFDRQLADLSKLELSAAGVSKNTSNGGTLFSGGVTDASKDTYQDSTAYIQPRFRRGQFYTSDTD